MQLVWRGGGEEDEEGDVGWGGVERLTNSCKSAVQGSNATPPSDYCMTSYLMKSMFKAGGKIILDEDSSYNHLGWQIEGINSTEHLYHH